MVIFSTVGWTHESPGGDARAEADHQDRSGVLMKQRGKVAEHALQAHIVGLGGGLHFSGDVEIMLAVGEFGNHDRGIAAFADVQRACRDSIAASCVGRRRWPARGRGKWWRSSRRWRRPRRRSRRLRRFPSDRAMGDEHDQRGDGGERDQQALRILRADPGNQDDAEGEGAENPADGVGGVDSRRPAFRNPHCAPRRRPARTGSSRPTGRRREKSPTCSA